MKNPIESADTDMDKLIPIQRDSLEAESQPYKKWWCGYGGTDSYPKG